MTDAHLLVAPIDEGETTARTFGLTTVSDETVYYVTPEIAEAARTTATDREISAGPDGTLVLLEIRYYLYYNIIIVVLVLLAVGFTRIVETEST